MAFIRVHCGYCNQPWEVYPHYDITADKARKCPHCASKIDRRTWEEVTDAFLHVQHANEELIKDHVDYHCPLYTVDFIEDRIFDGRQGST